MSIELFNVTKRFGRNVAVDDLTLTIPPATLFAFLGRNGAGKTTTIKLIAGLLRADAGRVRVCGLEMGTDGLLARARLAYVPDQPFLYEKITGREFLEFVGDMYRMDRPRVRARIADFADRLEMHAFLDQLTESYSHGMKQRVAIAAALLHDPQVLLIDEPMVGLDPQIARTVRNLFVEFTRAGGTVFMSTHTLEVAESIADRIGIISAGRLIAEGTLDELRRQACRQRSLEDIFLELTADPRDAAPETIVGD